MSLNGVREEVPSFVERQMTQVYIQEHAALRPNEIKNTSKGLRAFVFYRNYLMSKRKKLVGDRKAISIKLG